MSAHAVPADKLGACSSRPRTTPGQHHSSAPWERQPPLSVSVEFFHPVLLLGFFAVFPSSSAAWLAAPQPAASSHTDCQAHGCSVRRLQEACQAAARALHREGRHRQPPAPASPAVRRAPRTTHAHVHPTVSKPLFKAVPVPTACDFPQYTTHTCLCLCPNKRRPLLPHVFGSFLLSSLLFLKRRRGAGQRLFLTMFWL